MDLASVIARLRDQLTGFKTVGGAADLNAIFRGPVPTPSAYVVPMAEAAAPNGLIGAFDQAVTVEVGVLLAVSTLRDAKGEAALDVLKPFRDQVAAALLGWALEVEVGEPMEFAGGRLLRFDDGLLIWADEFRVKTYRGRS